MRRSPRRLVLIAGVSCLVVAVCTATFWEEVAIRYHLHRLRSDPDYMLSIVIGRVALEEGASAWASALRTDAGYMVEFRDHERWQESSPAWTAAREFIKSTEGMKALRRALESTDFDVGIAARVDEAQERRQALQESRLPRQ